MVTSSYEQYISAGGNQCLVAGSIFFLTRLLLCSQLQRILPLTKADAQLTINLGANHYLPNMFFFPHLLPDSSFFVCSQEYIHRASLIVVLPGTYFGGKYFRNTHMCPQIISLAMSFQPSLIKTQILLIAQSSPRPPRGLRREALCYMF